MRDERWIPIRFRGFHDIPRAFTTERGGETLLLDCPFDDALDDYPEHYTVVRLGPSATATLDESSWRDLASRGTPIGRIPTRLVTFDPTRRAAVDASVLDRL
ncbi:MAG TPA: hypothetical protein VHG91_01020 [Longimicrobium sp.]|nr:hypothetical protein [Longimicrobium sp.]